MKLKVTVNGTAYEVDVEVEEETVQAPGPIIIGGKGGAGSHSVPSSASLSGNSANAITAPLAGSVFKILVEEGQDIQAGDVVMILEAMKMETEITAPSNGKVAAILVGIGDPVQGGQGLIEIA